VRPKAKTNTRGLILDTARKHLSRFGEGKMTVVDIARSLGMSHANVYRFFKTKTQIVGAIVNEWLAKVEALVEGIAARPFPASERLEAVVLELHRLRRRKLEEDAEFYDAFRRMIQARPDAVAKRQEKIFKVFKKIIESGIASGEFSPVDPDEVAAVLEDATAIFLHPLIMPVALSRQSRNRARNVIRCVLAGFHLKARKVFLR
jgi:AcrR family transcriptional regulator